MMTEVLVPVSVFTAVVLALTILVVLARLWLEPSGTLMVQVNSNVLEVKAGELLLFALAEHGIYLPAACGGRGSCGQCRVIITRGARPLLPTEAPHIGPADAVAGMRLACMLKVVDPISIHLAEDVLTAQQTTALVRSNRSITPYLKALILEPESPLDFEPGDYVLVEAPAYRMEFSAIDIDSKFQDRWEENGFFKLRSRSRRPATRAYSLANPPSRPDRIELVIRIALPPPSSPHGTPPGCVSSYLFGLHPGDTVSLRGPFGDFHIQDTEREMVFLGGGAGIAPLRSMILELLNKKTARRISLWYGARDIDDICYMDEFQAAEAAHSNFSYHVALSSVAAHSDWKGPVGFIHSIAYEHYLRHHPEPQEIEVYLCGPPLMSAAALQMLEQLGVPRENVFFDDFGAA